MGVVVVVICGLLTLVGTGIAVLWRRQDVDPPWSWPDADVPRLPERIKRVVWSTSVGLIAGVWAGLLVGGPGGRLAMRLVGFTAGPAAQGKKTEAEEIVGVVTAGGTIGLVIFLGIAFGGFSGVMFALGRRALLRAPWTGLVLGGLLLVIGGPRVDPLRRDNFDFDVVGPGWLSVLAFSLLVVVHCCALTAIAGWVSKRLPVGADGRRTLWYLLLIPAVPFFPVLVFLFVVTLVVALVGGWAPLRRVAVSDRTWLGVRVLLGATGAAGAVFLYAPAVLDIIGRGPG